MPIAPWLVIVNPVAGRSRRDARAWRAMEQALRAAALAYDVAWTTGPGDGARIAAAAWQQGRERFLVAGGDGSVHDVVNGLLSAQHARGEPAFPDPARIPTVVPLPLGTGNDWSRSLELPGEPAALAAIILGQMIAGLVLDHLGAFGLPAQPVSARRIAAVALVAAGLMLSRL